jgi:hypothetical protein
MKKVKNYIPELPKYVIDEILLGDMNTIIFGTNEANPLKIIRDTFNNWEALERQSLRATREMELPEMKMIEEEIHEELQENRPEYSQKLKIAERAFENAKEEFKQAKAWKMLKWFALYATTNSSITMLPTSLQFCSK